MVDILAIGAHPDDVELACSGTIAKHVRLGYSVAVVDLTEGELGTRGTVETRYAEAQQASKILGIQFRENLQLPDGFLHPSSKEQKLRIIQAIRTYRPKIILANALSDRHPDHGNAATLVDEAVFLSGLAKIETFGKDGKPQEAYRTTQVFHYIQDRYIQPDLIVDISEVFELKMQSIQAYTTQFYDPNSKEAPTYIASESFLDTIKARCIEFGKVIGVKYAEGFTTQRIIGVEDLIKLS